ncbi:MAG: response regulator [Alphaproteobacteria bacterium]|nr:response regulator [Alphaproteobacteria bacterium]
MDATPHILIVDDDREIRDLLARFLVKNGLRASVAKDGAEMWRELEGGAIDLVVLDLMLPGEDGLSLCRKLRSQSQVPVVMLTAKGEEIDRIVGLEMGADDYLAKPFNPRELLARVKAVLRRSGARERDQAPPADRTQVRFLGWVFDLAARHLVDPKGEKRELSAGEYGLLRALVEHPQRVLSRDRLLDLARGRDAIPFDRSIDIQVSRLRRKLDDDPKEPAIIKTVRGGGYMFAPKVET